MTDQPGENGLADFGRFVRLNMHICPNCSSPIGEGMCCMTYTEWHCFGCGARLDSRVVSPRSVMRCDTDWPDYERHPGDPVHPLACSCTGRGWSEWEAADIGSPETPVMRANRLSREAAADAFYGSSAHPTR